MLANGDSGTLNHWIYKMFIVFSINRKDYESSDLRQARGKVR